MSESAHQLFIDTLPQATKTAFMTLSSFDPLVKGNWYLAGGTALALQVGHRKSVDLDFFHPDAEPNMQAIELQLQGTGMWETTNTDSGTLYGLFQGAKASFIAYPFFVPRQPFIMHGTIRILDAQDIAVMKIIAISQRNRKRDFIDLYWYCKNRERLAEVIKRVALQYPGQKHSYPHFFKSLTYFADADNDDMPNLNFEANWRLIKKFFQEETIRAAREVMSVQ